LVWGLDAMAITFVAPHSLHARPLVVPHGRALTVTNGTPDVSATVLADGQQVHELAPGAQVEARLSDERSLLATLPESTFFSRYRRTFGSEERVGQTSARTRHPCARLGPVPSLAPPHPGARVNMNPSRRGGFGGEAADGRGRTGPGRPDHPSPPLSA